MRTRTAVSSSLESGKNGGRFESLRCERLWSQFGREGEKGEIGAGTSSDMQILSRYIEGPFKGTISSMEEKPRVPQDSWSWGLSKYCYRFGLEMSAPGRRSCWKCILCKPFGSLKDVFKTSQKIRGGGEEKERIKNGANPKKVLRKVSLPSDIRCTVATSGA